MIQKPLFCAIFSLSDAGIHKSRKIICEWHRRADNIMMVYDKKCFILSCVDVRETLDGSMWRSNFNSFIHTLKFQWRRQLDWCEGHVPQCLIAGDAMPWTLWTLLIKNIKFTTLLMKSWRTRINNNCVYYCEINKM